MNDEYTAYCLSCRKKRKIKKPEEYTMKNGNNAIRGKCPECDGNIFRILPKKEDDK